MAHPAMSRQHRRWAERRFAKIEDQERRAKNRAERRNAKVETSRFAEAMQAEGEDKE